MAWFARLVYASRISQILFALIVICLSAPLCTYYGTSDNPFFAATAASSAIILLDGSIGFFAFKRPNDVHWHLTLTLDWLGFLLCLALCAIFTLWASLSDFDPSYRFDNLIVSGTVFSWLLQCATLTPIVWTYRLRRQGRLPPPSAKRDYWYHMEDQIPPMT